MYVSDLKRQAKLNKKKKKSIYNPDKKDFSCVFRNKEYTIKAQEIEPFPFHIANHIERHLANHLLHKRNWKSNRLEEIKEEIRV